MHRMSEGDGAVRIGKQGRRKGGTPEKSSNCPALQSQEGQRQYFRLSLTPPPVLITTHYITVTRTAERLWDALSVKILQAARERKP